MDWIKIGNRWYRKETVEEVDYVQKSVYHEEDDEYVMCGEWTVEVFLAHAEPFDQNTEDNYDEIKTELNIIYQINRENPVPHFKAIVDICEGQSQYTISQDFKGRHIMALIIERHFLSKEQQNNSLSDEEVGLLANNILGIHKSCKKLISNFNEEEKLDKKEWIYKWFISLDQQWPQSVTGFSLED